MKQSELLCIIKPRSPLPGLETSLAFFVKQRLASVNFSYRFQNFVSGLSCVQNPYAQLHHFGGVKAEPQFAALSGTSTPQTVASIRPIFQQC